MRIFHQYHSGDYLSLTLTKRNTFPKALEQISSKSVVVWLFAYHIPVPKLRNIHGHLPHSTVHNSTSPPISRHTAAITTNRGNPIIRSRLILQPQMSLRSLDRAGALRASHLHVPGDMRALGEGSKLPQKQLLRARNDNISLWAQGDCCG